MSISGEGNALPDFWGQNYEIQHCRQFSHHLPPQESHSEEPFYEASKYVKKQQVQEKKSKVLKKKKKKKLKRKDSSDYEMNRGHWTSDENRMYHWFLETHIEHFINKNLRRQDKIFKTMAQYITTRRPEQCRSHHQKIQKKYSSFYHIIKQFRQEYYDSLSTETLREDLNRTGFKQIYSLISDEEVQNQTKSFLKVEEVSHSENNFQEISQTFLRLDHSYQL